MGVRVSKRVQTEMIAEQDRAEKLTGIRPSLVEVARMLIERGLAANGRKR